jgi:hypothetical protein
MAGSFRPSATFFDISERSLEQPRKAIAPDAGQNLRVRRHEMDTWRTTNANPGVLLSRAIERAKKQNLRKTAKSIHKAYEKLLCYLQWSMARQLYDTGHCCIKISIL